MLAWLCLEVQLDIQCLASLLSMHLLVPGQSYLEGKAEEIITVLLAAARFQGSADVRAVALKCLAGIMKLPYNILHPHVRKVNKTLAEALDDPKRAVRLEAGRTRRLWNPM